VIARLQGNYGYKNAFTEKVDEWVAAHSLNPSYALLTRAAAVIDRILGEKSELRELWDETGENDWRNAVGNLRQRIGV
jgi:predicted secreted protein